MKIVFNGREYNRVEQMPENARQQYLELMKALDANNNGIPDVLERPQPPHVVVQETITYNGRQYHDRSELPPQIQRMLQHMAALKPGEPETRVEIQTEVSSPEIEIRTGSIDTPASALSPTSRRAVPLGLFMFLLAIAGVLLWLWLSGTKPGELFR